MQASALTTSVSDEPGAGWDEFVAAQPGAAPYLAAAWTRLARRAFGHRTFFIETRGADGQLRGVLPLVQQRGLLGNFATSIPFFNYGGPLATDGSARDQLIERARDLAMELGCSYLELRDVQPHAALGSTRTDKVSMVLTLPATQAALGKQLGSKLRSQIKRAERESPLTRTGGIELLDDFYRVFASNMRDLGTPVYPKRFFRLILETLPAATALLIVYERGRAAAAGFLVFDRGRAEIPWAACLATAKPLGFNMRLYWDALSFAIEKGCGSFDFGRSTRDSGTFKFKKQWGAEPLQLYWHRWERRPRPQDARGESRVMRMATAAWSRLPLGIANLLGPIVSPGLPW